MFVSSMLMGASSSDDAGEMARAALIRRDEEEEPLSSKISWGSPRMFMMVK